MKLNSLSVIAFSISSHIQYANGIERNENDTNACIDPKEEITCSEEDDEILWWKDISEKCRKEYSSKGWNEELWDHNPEEQEELDWDEIPQHRKDYLMSIGWTEDKWGDLSHVNPYDLTWDLLSQKRRDALIVLGWTEEDWKIYSEDGDVPLSTSPRGDSKKWDEMNELERGAMRDLGFNKTTWHVDRLSPALFEPNMTNVDIPALKKFDFKFFEKLDLPVQVNDGATVGDDEFSAFSYMQLSEYMKLFHQGTNLYLKYEDGEAFHKKLHGIIGKEVYHAFKESLRKEGLIKAEWDNIYKHNEENWSFWLGAAGTSTSLHIDYDVFNFLWVMEGKKRIVMIPNTKETRAKYRCKVFVQSHSCWPEVDVLHGDLPENAVEFIIGPGQGIAIPRLAWHAVENLEPTIAFGFRMEDYLY